MAFGSIVVVFSSFSKLSRFHSNCLFLYYMLASQLTSLELQYVSPKLLMCRDLELAVPGTYDPNQPIIRIQSIAPSLQVITSKQRPRKLTIMGKIRR